MAQQRQRSAALGVLLLAGAAVAWRWVMVSLLVAQALGCARVQDKAQHGSHTKPLTASCGCSASIASCHLLSRMKPYTVWVIWPSGIGRAWSKKAISWGRRGRSSGAAAAARRRRQQSVMDRRSTYGVHVPATREIPLRVALPADRQLGHRSRMKARSPSSTAWLVETRLNG